MSKHSTLSPEAKLEAIDKSLARIEFNLEGIIQDANENFCNAIGYSLDEIRGKNHRMFVEPSYGASNEYREFWDRLARGQFFSAEFKRFAKGGREIWIQATYNPVLDKKGKPVGVVKFATDITPQKLATADAAGQLSAIGKSQAVIEFDLDGIVQNANENFLNTVGYSLDEIKGRHHRQFVDPAYGESAEYKDFWNRLRNGEYQAGEYKRYGKGQNEVWINASYNPIFDMSGKPFKVVKYATNITDEKKRAADTSGQIAAIGKSQAVIEFDMDGIVQWANENFLSTVGYGLDEIKGRHHRQFVESGYGDSAEYRDFWEKLRRGEYQAGEFKRVGKGGKEIWIQASYNPIYDMNGKPFKVVKYASDITPIAQARKDIARSTQEALLNVQTVASAAEEMTASIQEISKNNSRSQMAVSEIRDHARAADQATEQLTKATQDMDKIAQLIESVAGQINLLALNATIESARAGEAGRGFAVVAGEVKNLAHQTATATKQISDEIQSMQGVAAQVVSILQSITQSVESVSELVNSTAAAVEEQSVVTQEISGNMQTAAQGVLGINEKMNALSNAA